MVISIVRFMSEYYGIALDAGYRYSHRKIKKTFKELKGCSFEYADDNPELVSSGKIVYVRDGYDRVFPYVCPNEKFISVKQCEFTSKEELAPEIDILSEISEMPTYMVRELLSKYKDKPSFYKIIKLELIERGVYSDKRHKSLKENSAIADVDDKISRRGKIRIRKRGRWN